VEKAHATDVMDSEYVIVWFAMLSDLPKEESHREAEDIHNPWFEVLCPERVKYYDNHAKKAETACKQWK